jgi:mycothiol synthase
MELAARLKRTGLARRVKSLLRALPASSTSTLLFRMHRKLHPDERLPSSPLPEPYRLRVYEAGGENAWLDLLNASAEFGAWNRDRLEREILSTLLPGGGIFAAHEGRLIGCASVCFMKEYSPNAILMYVALLPEHRGKGLGQALVWETLRVSQRERYPAMILHTENHRHAAVRTYFQLGFLPQLAEGVADKWQWATMLNMALLGGESAREGRG